jgi:type II secretory pathway component PulF
MMKTSLLKSARKWNRRDLIMLFERLGMYISAGLAPTDALFAACGGASKKQKAALETVKGSVEQGGLLSRSLREQMKISPTIAGLIEHGEDSGELAKALTAAKTILEREDALVKTCLSAMAYPSIIGIFAILMTVGLMKGVMPQIIPLLESLHVQLPILTIAVIFLSENLIKYGVYALGAAIIIIPSAIFLYKKIRRIRFVCHSIILRIPIVGRLARYYSLALTVRSLGSLVESGAALGESYVRVAETIPLLPLRLVFEKKSVDISRGVPLGTVLSGMKRMPSYIAPLVSAGEASGTLGISLVRGADILDRDIEHALKRLTALVEPVMMAGMGCAVGAIALSIMMPIYDVSKALQH